MRVRLLTGLGLEGVLEKIAGGDEWNQWYRLDGGDLPMPVLARVGRNAEGRLVVISLLLGVTRAGGQPIGGRDLRRVRMAGIAEAIAEQQMAFDELMPGSMDKLTPDVEASALKPGRPGRRGYPREFYERVAAEYRQTTNRPVVRIAELHDVEIPTARGWVRRARDLGLLGESIAGKAGERKRRRRR